MIDNDTNIPVEHQELVMERIKESQQNPEVMLDWEIALTMLRP